MRCRSFACTHLCPPDSDGYVKMVTPGRIPTALCQVLNQWGYPSGLGRAPVPTCGPHWWID